jgi:hypothetical protein
MNHPTYVACYKCTYTIFQRFGSVQKFGIITTSWWKVDMHLSNSWELGYPSFRHGKEHLSRNLMKSVQAVSIFPSCSIMFHPSCGGYVLVDSRMEFWDIVYKQPQFQCMSTPNPGKSFRFHVDPMENESLLAPLWAAAMQTHTSHWRRKPAVLQAMFGWWFGFDVFCLSRFFITIRRTAVVTIINH